MLGCSRESTCAGQSAWNSDTWTNPCQVLGLGGHQPSGPPFSPENQHFGRGKGQRLLLLCVVSPENERKMRKKRHVYTCRSILSSLVSFSKGFDKDPVCLPTIHKYCSGSQRWRKKVHLGSGELQGVFFPVVGNFSWEGNFIPGPGTLPDHFKIHPRGE